MESDIELVNFKDSILFHKRDMEKAIELIMGSGVWVMNEDKEMPSYYSIIPATVRYDHNLKANEKLMYGEITALASKNGYCWAENRYFAELYDVHKITISNWLKNLEDKGYIRTELKYVYGTKQVSKRLIYIKDRKSVV